MTASTTLAGWGSWGSPMVEVYWNFNRKMFSVKALDGPDAGKVVAHKIEMVLHGAKFHVSPAGHARALRGSSSVVHATARGTWISPAFYMRWWREEVTYDPGEADAFLVGCRNNGHRYAVRSALQVKFLARLTDRGVVPEMLVFDILERDTKFQRTNPHGNRRAA